MIYYNSMHRSLDPSTSIFNIHRSSQEFLSTCWTMAANVQFALSSQNVNVPEKGLLVAVNWIFSARAIIYHFQF